MTRRADSAWLAHFKAVVEVRDVEVFVAEEGLQFDELGLERVAEPVDRDLGVLAHLVHAELAD